MPSERGNHDGKLRRLYDSGHDDQEECKPKHDSSHVVAYTVQNVLMAH